MLLVEASRKTEIGELDMSVLVYQDVVWLYVTIIKGESIVS